MLLQKTFLIENECKTPNGLKILLFPCDDVFILNVSLETDIYYKGNTGEISRNQFLKFDRNPKKWIFFIRDIMTKN